MAQQTSYANNPPGAINGLVAPQEGTVIWSKLASGSVPIGLLCSPGAQSLSFPGATISLPTAGEAGNVLQYPSGHTDDPVLDIFAVGIPIFDSALMQSSQITTFTQGTFSVSAYVDQQTVPVLRKGCIWVISAQATTQFGPAYVYTTSETNNPLGSWGYGTGTGKSLFSRGRWLMTTAGAGLSLLEIW